VIVETSQETRRSQAFVKNFKETPSLITDRSFGEDFYLRRAPEVGAGAKQSYRSNTYNYVYLLYTLLEGGA